MERIPKALRQDSIIEAVFEIRFKSLEPSAADLLPGMVLPRLRSRFQTLQALPLAQVPRAMRQLQPALAYQPVNALVGANIRLGLGDQVASLSVIRPYPGWAKFRPQIGEAIEALEKTGIIGEIERFSLKYVNVLPLGKDASDLSILRLKLELGAFELRGPGRIIRAEIEHNGSIHVVQVSSQAEVNLTMPG
ncbi:MAG: TIGR04255 family protein, partial [bacterium]